MIYVTGNTCDRHMLWQIQVQHSNFNRLGIDLKNVYNLVVYKYDIDEEYLKYAKYTKANIVFIKDIVHHRPYLSSMRTYAYKYLLDIMPELEQEYIFYCDQDVIFRELPNFKEMSNNKIYFSDTISYVGANYIISKGDRLFVDMCNMVGINPDLVKKYQSKSGGCQIYGKGFTSKYWDKVEKDSTNLYVEFNDINKYANDFYVKNNTEITKANMLQIWCADMWAILWNLWLFGYDTEIHNDLKFAWASGNISDYHNTKILHNTGLSNSDTTNVFNKADVGSKLLSEIRSDILIRENSCTFPYYIETLQAKMWLNQLYGVN